MLCDLRPGAHSRSVSEFTDAPERAGAMPFDGTDPRAAAAIAMIDALLDFFDGGKKWLHHGFHNDDGNRCLVSAMAHIRQRDKTRGDHASRYIRLAVRGSPRMLLAHSLMSLNDACTDYAELADILRCARAIAEGTASVASKQEIRKQLADMAERRKIIIASWALRQASLERKPTPLDIARENLAEIIAGRQAVPCDDDLEALFEVAKAGPYARALVLKRRRKLGRSITEQGVPPAPPGLNPGAAGVRL
jgi:hypothetical protein